MHHTLTHLFNRPQIRKRLTVKIPRPERHNILLEVNVRFSGRSVVRDVLHHFKINLYEKDSDVKILVFEDKFLPYSNFVIKAFGITDKQFSALRELVAEFGEVIETKHI